MLTLHVDIETYSDQKLDKVGVYKYAESPAFEVLLLAYRFNDEPVRCIDLANFEEIPQRVLDALSSPFTRKKAFNANFERVCLSKYLGTKMHASQWECTMVKCAMLGLPMSLEVAAKALKVQQQKDTEGKALIRYFTMPCKPTKKNAGRTRNYPEHDPEKWQRFISYCNQDVEAETAVDRAISFFQIPENEKKLWYLDQRINDRGVRIDKDFVNNAIRFDLAFAERLAKQAAELTGLENPNSPAQLKKWMLQETGLDIPSLNKHVIPVLLKHVPIEKVKNVLKLRQQMSKTSVKKYVKMHHMHCSDKVVRGILQHCGAGRTWRWAGRGVQVHNLTKHEIELEELDLARRLVLQGDMEMLEVIFGNVPDILSQLIRTSFIPRPGNRFLVSDFSAIEARVIAWLSGEKWRLEVFKTHGRIYEASAAQMFKVPIESISYVNDKGKVVKGPNYKLRGRGKIGELALGFQGGANALASMEITTKVPEEDRIPEAEKPAVVDTWRAANPSIVQHWYNTGNAAIRCVDSGAPQNLPHGCGFSLEKGILYMHLPSGRRLAYYKPSLIDGPYNRPALTYWGMDQTSKQWRRIDSYGGKLVENQVQAIARDILGAAMLRVDKAGYPIALHVHDEIVTEKPYGEGSIKEINRIMSEPIPWAKGLPLSAETFETNYYRKD